jgi:hypothetical protein
MGNENSVKPVHHFMRIQIKSCGGTFLFSISIKKGYRRSIKIFEGVLGKFYAVPEIELLINKWEFVAGTLSLIVRYKYMRK